MANQPVGQLLRALLVADAGVTALLGTRVYPSELPQGATLPAAVYTVVSDVPESSLDGHTSTTIQSARVQVDCYARPSAGGGAYTQAHAVAEAVKSVLGNITTPDMSGHYESSRDLFDNVSQYHRVSMDFTIWR